MAMRGQDFSVGLSGNDIAQDMQPGQAGDVTNARCAGVGSFAAAISAYAARGHRHCARASRGVTNKCASVLSAR